MFAHRGGALEGLENTMAGFQRCIDLGYRYLETDVHATADGVLLAFHDADLARVTDRTGRIARLPAAEVGKARIGGTDPIPLLEELLGAWPDARVNIDLKAAGSVPALAAVLRRTNALDRVCVASFSAIRLTTIRNILGPRVCTSMSPREVVALRMASYSPRAAMLVRSSAACVQIPCRVGGRQLLDARLVTAAHDRGLPVHVWPVDTETDLDDVLALDVDGVMTDRPGPLREALRERGRWTGR